MRCKKRGPLSPIPGLRGIWAPARQARCGRSTQATSDTAARPQRRFPDGFRRTGPDFMLRALRMRYGHSTRRAPRLRSDRFRARASETRLMGIIETGSDRRNHSDREQPSSAQTVSVRPHPSRKHAAGPSPPSHLYSPDR